MVVVEAIPRMQAQPRLLLLLLFDRWQWAAA
jgi:hypothetical protein